MYCVCMRFHPQICIEYRDCHCCKGPATFNNIEYRHMYVCAICRLYNIFSKGSVYILLRWLARLGGSLREHGL